jgi:hypothetical protein
MYGIVDLLVFPFSYGINLILIMYGGVYLLVCPSFTHNKPHSFHVQMYGGVYLLVCPSFRRNKPHSVHV